jgi:hypothetical protein
VEERIKIPNVSTIINNNGGTVDCETSKLVTLISVIPLKYSITWYHNRIGIPKRYQKIKRKRLSGFPNFWFFTRLQNYYRLYLDPNYNGTLTLFEFEELR